MAGENRELKIRLLKDLGPHRNSFEMQAILKYLHLEYDDIKDAIVECPADKVMELRGGAKAYRDLINKLTRVVSNLAQLTENKDG